MRLIRRLLLLTFVVAGGVAAYAYWSGNGLRLGEKAGDVAAETARRGAARAASEVAEKASDAAGTVGHTIKGEIKDSALTAKIKSKMALDDHVKARAIDVDTDGSVAT